MASRQLDAAVDWVTTFGRLRVARSWPAALERPHLLDEIRAALPHIGPAHFERPGRRCMLRVRGLDAALKVKGLCGCVDGALVEPGAGVYLRDNPHLGFDEQDRFRFVASAPSPLAGIARSRATAELETAAALSAASVRRAPRPVALLEFLEPARVFRTADGASVEPLAVAILAFDGPDSRRVDALLPPQEWAAGIADFEGVLFGLGGALRRFHDAGFYRFSSTPDNYRVGMHGAVQLVDLDSTQQSGPLAPRRRWLETARDVCGALFNTATFVIAPERAVRLAPADLPAADLFEAILRGYGDDASDTATAATASRFARWFLPIYSRVHAQGAQLLALPTAAERSRVFRTMWIDRAQAYGGLMALVTASPLLAHLAVDYAQAVPWRRFAATEASRLAATSPGPAWWHDVPHPG